jgi:diaminohydroxyphosphoribosylaminopyrimidine deaminase / 5-amino-6-(5-phosphoribosylamino)uracil reductase
VRLPGLESRSPQKFVLTRGEAPEGWTAIPHPVAITSFGLQHLLVEGGAEAADAFLSAGLVDRLLLYRSLTAFGDGVPAFRNPGSDGVPPGWRLADRRQLGSDTLESYYPAENKGA